MPGEKIEKIREMVKLVRRSLFTEKELRRVEVIMLRYEDGEVAKDCVARITENTDWPFKLTVYDTRSQPRPTNISKVWNKLIRESTCDYVMILDSDVFVPKLEPCWLTRMMGTFEKDCHVVVPRVNRTSCPQMKADRAEEYPAEPERLKEILAAQCVLYEKEIFEKIGYFDEDFLLYGQDSEWGDRLLKSPFKGYVRTDVLLDHIGSYAINKAVKIDNYDSSLEREYAGILFKEKTK